MGLFSSIVGIIAAVVALVIVLIVLALIVDIAKWLMNPEENSGLEK